ncbi:MAG: hypothetical protein A3B25_02375 [Candidatus Ryanbacteria bacterium RIFCSPLOWO2_01_FULL_48_26]|uniref:Peptidase S74 domain-containing protein n=1 Tax=Candidatus Ryanbacteria bacterium RIFCSPLOWO2_01_FULL_48_26 TaxID=1802126 RepID=A0A1G2GRD8_9BACT|nr:MAG: hypothetical protein A3B25_02375 [Candidatus Ryanbacteria bacterium RIFCSPLOWO2_01_FULL_48_26]
MRNLRNTSVFITIAFVLILASFWGYTLYVSGFTGPSQVPGSGGGVIVADSSNNIGIGTSTTRAYSKFLVVSSSTDSNNYAIIVLQPNGNPIFAVRNDGMVGVATSTPNAGTLTVQGNIYSTGAFTGTIAAANVTAGVFSSGNFAFPSSVGIATTTQVGLPQPLSVYGNEYISGSLGIGVTNPNSAFQVANLINFDLNRSSTFVGYQSGAASTGNYNSGFGVGTLQFNTSGVNNTAFGRNALNTNTIGNNNSAFGHDALTLNDIGSQNSAFGRTALSRNTSGGSNSAFGFTALYTNTIGYDNSAFGDSALFSSINATSNSAFGFEAGKNITSGSKNTLMGTQAGYVLTTGSGNIMIGSGVQGLSATQSNSLNIGNLIYGNLSTGMVGIGTSTPQAILSVGDNTAGLVAVFGGGAGKINVGTVDPIYTIDGKKYATYLPAMTGQKEETTGVVYVTGDPLRWSENEASEGQATATWSYKIDFNKVEEGSDLWLFNKVTALKNNFDNLAVLLTPSFDGKVWYEKDAAKRTLTIFAIPESGAGAAGSSEISYRLSAPRFDADQWKNTTNDPSAGFVIGK